MLRYRARGQRVHLLNVRVPPHPVAGAYRLHHVEVSLQRFIVSGLSEQPSVRSSMSQIMPHLVPAVVGGASAAEGEAHGT